MANTKRITITADSTLSVNGNSNQMFDFGQIRAQLSTTEADEFWNNVKSDGGDIRVYYNDGSTQTQVAVDLRIFDSSTETGYMVFDSSDHAASTATTWDIEFGDAALSQPAATDTFGRNAVYSQVGEDYEAVLSFDEDPSGTAPQFVDRTGNGYNGTAVNMDATNQVSAPIGNAVSFNGTDERITLASTLTTPHQSSGITTWVYSNSNSFQWFAGYDVNSDHGIAINIVNDRFRDLNNGQTDFLGYASGFLSVDTWYHSTYSYQSNGSINHYTNSTANPDNPDPSNTDDLLINEIGTTAGNFDFALSGRLSEFRAANFEISGNWAEEEYNNQSNQSGFWSVSDVSNIGGDQTISLSDSITITDSLNSASNEFVLSDNIAINDSLNSVSNQFIVSDVIPMIDSINSASNEFTINDSIGYTDNANFDIQLLLADAISYSDALNSIENAFTLTDTISITDSITVTKTTFIQLSDSIGYTDSIKTLEAMVEVSDSIGFSDALASIGAEMTITDSISISDSIQQLNVEVTLSDGVSFTDSIAVNKASVGEATKVTIEAKKLYNIALEAKKLYTINLDADELID